MQLIGPRTTNGYFPAQNALLHGSQLRVLGPVQDARGVSDAEWIETLFMVMGKMVYLGQIGPEQEAGYRKATAGLTKQVSGTEGAFTDLPEAPFPVAVDVDRLVEVLVNAPARMQVVVKQYLRKWVGPKIGAPAGADVSRILQMLVREMVLTYSTADTNGEDGFVDYFRDRFGVDLPADGAPTIDDAWIGDTVDEL